MPASAREEAERLVAAILARAVTGSGGHSSGDGFGLLGESVAGLIGVLSRSDLATGSAECCVCPVCKAIAAVRDPSPETAERLATSAGDIASGVAGLMRAFSSMAVERPRPPAPRSRPAPTPDQAWSTATRPASPEQEPPARDEESDPWGAASAADAREAAAAARARAAAAEEAVAKAVARAKARAARPAEHGAARPAAAGSRPGDVWAMATSEAAAGDAARPRSVDHELGAAAPEDRDAGPGDDARPGSAV
ncbi:hypothetical protein QLQ12_05145 [Actinoplanes sp. NEAU-A12]|uniref:Uncharacterized protein n=1 Tax=Actinoplanes sandaracinus TaxID=3045177 RepID=A0ABT6WE31_9ACTN|nr:hypothetical protein [Actinoplanes sandaracinus]MDI6097986.1 hypothetical protein [Actinoplanes sandaracinus]